MGAACFGTSLVAQQEGKWSEAREFSDRGLAAASRYSFLPNFRAQLEHELGNYQQGESYLEQGIELMRAAPEGGNW